MADIDEHKPLIEKLAKKRILVIDDDGLITRTLCDLLHRAGFYAEASNDGADAIDKTEDTDFDLIISDVKMPDIDGIETVRRMRAASKARNKRSIPVIFITGYANSPETKKAMELGEVIFKPFDTNEFLKKVEKYI